MNQTLARLKPYNPKKGNLLRTYTVFGTKYQVERGWYPVSEEHAKYLAKVKQPHGGPSDETGPAFDICSAEEAAKIDAEENQKSSLLVKAEEYLKEAKRVHNATKGGDLTTADLAKPSKPKASASFDEQPATFDDDMAPPAPVAAPAADVSASPSLSKRFGRNK